MTSTLKKISRRVALTLAVSACFSPVTQAAELLTEGVFKVGMEVTYPPFESYDSNNNIVGLDPEFAALIAQHLQAKPQLIDTKFTSLILGIGKKYDAVISGMYVTPERQKQADAIPYALSGASIIALKGGAVQPKTEDELCGVKVGLQAGTTWVTSLKKHSDEWCLKNGKPAITIQEFPTAPGDKLYAPGLPAAAGDLRRQRQHRAGGGDQGHPGHAEGQRPICRVDQKIQLRKHRLRQ